MNITRFILETAVVMLAITGLAWVLARVADGLERAWDWLSWRFRVDDGDDYADGAGDYAEPLEELPPERTWEQMTSHQLPVTACTGRRDCRCGHGYHDNPLTGTAWAPQRERRAPWWEAEHRAAYESLDLEYPSGLLARVRGEL